MHTFVVFRNPRGVANLRTCYALIDCGRISPVRPKKAPVIAAVWPGFLELGSLPRSPLGPPVAAKLHHFQVAE